MSLHCASDGASFVFDSFSGPLSLLSFLLESLACPDPLALRLDRGL